MGPCLPSLKSYVLITAASPLDQSMAGEVFDWFDIVGTGMLTWALQVYGMITVDHVFSGPPVLNQFLYSIFPGFCWEVPKDFLMSKNHALDSVAAGRCR